MLGGGVLDRPVGGVGLVRSVEERPRARPRDRREVPAAGYDIEVARALRCRRARLRRRARLDVPRLVPEQLRLEPEERREPVAARLARGDDAFGDLRVRARELPGRRVGEGGEAAGARAHRAVGTLSGRGPEPGGLDERARCAGELAEGELDAAGRVEQLEAGRAGVRARTRGQLERRGVEGERLAQPGPGGGAVAGRDEVAERLLRLPGAAAVERDRLGRWLVRPGERLDGVRDRRVEAGPPRRPEAVVDRVANDRVVEVVAGAVLVHELRVEARVERGDGLVRGEAGDDPHRLELEACPGHGGRGEQGLGAAPEQGDAPADRRGRIRGERLAGVALRADHLLDEERRTVGDPVDVRDVRLRDGPPAQIRHLLAHPGERQAGDPHAARAARSRGARASSGWACPRGWRPPTRSPRS